MRPRGPFLLPAQNGSVTTGDSNIKGIYPCGEGAGYAGGIMSAAVDGIKTAQKHYGGDGK